MPYISRYLRNGAAYCVMWKITNFSSSYVQKLQFIDDILSLTVTAVCKAHLKVETGIRGHSRSSLVVSAEIQNGVLSYSTITSTLFLKLTRTIATTVYNIIIVTIIQGGPKNGTRFL